MSDWKQDYLDRVRKEEEARRHEQYLRACEKDEREREKQQREHAAKIDRHQRNFRCSVCRRVSIGPKTEKVCVDDVRDGIPARYRTIVHWNEPTGLERCSRCGSWACNNDYVEDGYYTDEGQYSKYISTRVCKNCSHRR